MFPLRPLRTISRRVSRSSRFLPSRSDTFLRQTRRFSAWDEFKKDDSFQEFKREAMKSFEKSKTKMDDLSEKVTDKTKDLKDSEAWNNSTKVTEAGVNMTKKRFTWLKETVQAKRVKYESVQSSESKVEEVGGDGQEAVKKTWIRSKTQIVREKVSGVVREKVSGVGSKIGNVGARVKDATKNARSKLFTKNLNPEEQKQKIQEKFSGLSNNSGEIGKKIFFKTTTTIKETFIQQKAEAEETENISSHPNLFFVEGCVGSSIVCNGYYKIQKDLVNDRPVYKGPKLESGEHATLWFSEKLNQWVFTKDSEINGEEDIIIFAYTESQEENPLEIDGGWHIASRRGRFLPHAGLTVSDQFPFPTAPTDAVVVFQRELNWYQKHASDFQRSQTYRKLENMTHTIRQKKTVRQLNEAGVRFQEKVQNIREDFDDSQNPMVHSLREKVDLVSMETEYGAGIKAIQRDFDPDFWPEDFADYAEEEIIPVFVAKFLEGDMTWLRLACTGEAERYCFASVKERMAQEAHWDTTILWINATHLDAVLLENKKPFVRFQTSVQHVDCSRNPKGEVIDGGPVKIANSVFIMTATPHPENFDRVGFPWQIHGLVTQRQHALM